MKKKKVFPDFNKMSLEEEANWWDTHDLGDYWDQLKPLKIGYVKRQKKVNSVTIRLEPKLKERLDQLARTHGTTLSTLTRMWIIEKLRKVS